MSARARRHSRSPSDEELLEDPKVRDKSKQPTIYVKRGGAVLNHVPHVGEVIWGVVDCVFIPVGQPWNPTILRGKEFAEVPVTVIEIDDKDVLVAFNVAGTDDSTRTMTGKVPRTDANAALRKEDDPYTIAKKYGR